MTKATNTMENSNTSTGGISLLGLLTVAFIVLKLCKVISWSWLWVLAPIWIPLAIALSILLITWIVTGIVNKFSK